MKKRGTPHSLHKTPNDQPSTAMNGRSGLTGCDHSTGTPTLPIAVPVRRMHRDHFRYAYDLAKIDFLGTSDHTDIGKIYHPYEWWHNQ